MDLREMCMARAGDRNRSLENATLDFALNTKFYRMALH